MIQKIIRILPMMTNVFFTKNYLIKAGLVKDDIPNYKQA